MQNNENWTKLERGKNWKNDQKLKIEPKIEKLSKLKIEQKIENGAKIGKLNKKLENWKW